MSKAKFNQSETVTIKRSQIKFAPYNPKAHTKEQINQIKRNIKKVAFLGGIVWNENTGNLVDGHKRIYAMDAIYGYDGTPATDYDVKVEKCNLDEKTEKEQNVFQTASRTELDYGMLAGFVNEITFTEAGLTESDMQMISFESPNFDFVPAAETKKAVQQMNDDNNQIKEQEKSEAESEKERQEKIDKVKAVKQEQKQPSNFVKHFVVTFNTVDEKIYFLERLGIEAETEFVSGETLEKLIFESE